MSVDPLPFRPVRRGGAAAALPCGYALDVATFEVEEVPAYQPSGQGDHLYLWVEKRGVATFDVADRLARAFGVPPRAVGYAGLKDKHATARQWFSIEGGDGALAERLDEPGVTVLRTARHGNKLKLGHLRGNRFRIHLRDCPRERVEDASAALADFAQRGVPNWFGEQRFGSGGRNLDKGLRILHGNPHRARRRMTKPLLRLLVSAVQSEVFNRVLAARIASTDRLEDGDVAWLHQNGACFVVEDAAAEQARCARFELSPSGPLPGPRTLAPKGAQAVLEARAMAEVGVTAEHFAQHATNPGERRPLRVRLTEPSAEPAEPGIVLSFALDRGAYATAVLQELCERAPWFVPGPAPL